MYQRDEEGGLIDPPVIAEFEAKLQAAHARGDQEEINDLQEQYHEARNTLADRQDQREQERRDAEAEQAAQRQERQRAADEEAQQAERARQDAVRAAAAEQENGGAQ